MRWPLISMATRSWIPARFMSGVIPTHEQRFQITWKFHEQPFVFVLLEESLPHILLFEFGDNRLAVHQRRDSRHGSLGRRPSLILRTAGAR